MVPLEVKEFFDRYWSEAGLRRFDRYDDFLQIVNADLFDKMAERAHRRMLAIGVGESVDRARLASLGGRIIAVDIARGGLKHLHGFSPLQMDVHHLGFKSRTFDAIFIRTVLLHCRHTPAMHELVRVLNENGLLFWVEPLKHNPFLWLYRCIASPGRLTRTDYMTFDEFRELERSFVTVWHRECYLFTVLLLPVFLAFPSLRRVILFLQRMELRLVDIVPWLKRWCWISYGYAGEGKCS